MEDLALLKKIRGIQFNAIHLADALFAGAYRSAFRGQGIEFEEVREYQSGDEIRNIDWNVTARAGRPFVKSFREEREMSVMLLVDISGSTQYGSQSQLKSDLAAELSALLAFSAISNNDRVGLILFSDRIEKYVPPKKGLSHILRIVREVLTPRSTLRKTDIAAALIYAGKLLPHASICFLISDFMAPDFSQQARMMAKKHDLFALHIFDSTEKQFPRMHLLNCSDAETQEMRIIDTSSLDVLEHFKQEQEERMIQQKKGMRQIGVGWLSIETNRPYLAQLKNFLSSKGRQ